MSEPRSTRELWPNAAHAAAVAALEDAMRPEELAEVTSTLRFYHGYCVGRYVAGQLTYEDVTLLRDLTDVARQFGELATSWQAYLERRRMTMREIIAVPAEWHILLDPACPERLLPTAAAEYARRANLPSRPSAALAAAARPARARTPRTSTAPMPSSLRSSRGPSGSRRGSIPRLPIS